MSTVKLIIAHISALPINEPFTTASLLQYGKRSTVDTALHRLIDRGEIVRLARGIFMKAGADLPQGEVELTVTKTFKRTFSLDETEINKRNKKRPKSECHLRVLELTQPVGSPDDKAESDMHARGSIGQIFAFSKLNAPVITSSGSGPMPVPGVEAASIPPAGTKGFSVASTGGMPFPSQNSWRMSKKALEVRLVPNVIASSDNPLRKCVEL